MYFGDGMDCKSDKRGNIECSLEKKSKLVSQTVICFAVGGFIHFTTVVKYVTIHDHHGLAGWLSAVAQPRPGRGFLVRPDGEPRPASQCGCNLGIF